MRYAEARPLILHGDVLLFKSHGIVAHLIRRSTQSAYSHAGVAFWMNERLMLAESREGAGCRLLPLSSAIGRETVDVYRARTPLSMSALFAMNDALVSRLGQPYGWHAILRDVLARLTLVSLLSPRRFYSDDDLEDAGRYVKCSTYVALAYRAAGIDLVPNLSDRSTAPAHLAQSAALARWLSFEGDTQ